MSARILSLSSGASNDFDFEVWFLVKYGEMILVFTEHNPVNSTVIGSFVYKSHSAAG